MIYGLKERLEAPIMGADVSGHLERFNTNGLTPDEADTVVRFIETLGSYIGTALRPGNCAFIPVLTPVAEDARSITGMDRYFGPIRTKEVRGPFAEKLGTFHYFWKAKTPDGRMLVIDPTGVPENLRSGARVVPYIGLSVVAPGPLKGIYENAESLSTSGLMQSFYDGLIASGIIEFVSRLF